MKLKPRVFLDTNVFVYAFEFPNSNSRLIIDLLNEGEVEAVVSERVFKEVYRYFRRFHSKGLADEFRVYMFSTCQLILSSEVCDKMSRYRGEVKDKDLEQTTTVREYGIKHLVSYDKDFEDVKEYITPREFVRQLGIRPRQTEY